jgi:hypothetical protein
MVTTTRMGRATLDDDEVQLSVDDLESGISVDESQSRDFNTQKKRRQSRLFDSSPFDRFVFSL